MYIFCQKCSKKITKKTKNLFICNHCGFHLYENPRPTTAVIFTNDKEEILLIKRKKAPKKDYWDTPGGFVDLNETLEESVKREIKEELNIELKTFKYIGSYYGRYFYKGINYHTLCFAFAAKMPDKKVKTSDEISALKFFKKQEIPIDKIAFVEVKNVLKNYLSSFNQSPGSENGK